MDLLPTVILYYTFYLAFYTSYTVLTNLRRKQRTLQKKQTNIENVQSKLNPTKRQKTARMQYQEQKTLFTQLCCYQIIFMALPC